MQTDICKHIVNFIYFFIFSFFFFVFLLWKCIYFSFQQLRNTVVEMKLDDIGFLTHFTKACYLGRLKHYRFISNRCQQNIHFSNFHQFLNSYHCQNIFKAFVGQNQQLVYR